MLGGFWGLLSFGDAYEAFTKDQCENDWADTEGLTKFGSQASHSMRCNSENCSCAMKLVLSANAG